MDKYEIARKASSLPQRFADRIPRPTLCAATRDNVEVTAVIERSGDILTGWPEEGGPGVVRNPRKGSHDRN